MADRFPLILNTSNNQIQELASGDNLDLTGSGIKSSGITTYTTSAQLVLGGGTNINSGTRGDILYYGSAGTIQKLSLGATGKILKSNGTDLVYGDSGSVVNVYYVSPAGTDASGFGGSVDRPFKTIKYACSNIGTPTATSPAIIFIKAGTYEEVQLPIIVPAHTTIAGDSLRATIIKPGSGLDSGGSIQNNRSILFRMSNATVLQDLVMDGMGGYTPGSPAHKPESATIGGVYLALNAASPVLTKSPYIYNVTSFGNGATGAVLDGSVHASGNRSMLFHTYTAVHSDGLGIFLKNNANAEMISTFTYYCTVGFACIGGSKIRSLNSSNAYGEYAVYSAGFDAGESANQGTVKGTMLTYVGVLGQDFTAGEQITGGTSGATAYAVNVQAEPKRIYIVQKSGTFQANETVTGGSSGATATLAAASFETNQSGRILVTTFSSSADAGDSLQFASTDGNAYQIQSVSSVTANSVAYHVLVFSTSRATPVPTNTTVNVRKEFSLIRLTGHDFLQVGTGGTDTTNWPNNPTQNPNQAYQVMTNSTDPGRVYYTATDELGNFYVGDQFKVDQATGNVTLDASAFNLSGLESLRLGSVGGLIGAAVGEFSTDITLSQNSDAKVPTQKAVKTYVDTLDDVTPSGGTFTVAGISTVTGTTQFTKQLNVSGVSTFHGNVNLLDGDRLRIGSSEDLQIYHDSNNSYIAENGGGNLLIQASAGSILLQRDNGHEMIKANVGGSVDLYHNDTLRLATTSDGAAVTGNLSVSGVLTYEDVTNVDSVGLITARNGITVSSGTATFQGAIDANGDLDVDGHTNLDNINIAGVTTTTGVVVINAGTESTSTTTGALRVAGGVGIVKNLHVGGDATFNGGTGAITIAAGGDIRMASGGWTGEHAGKIQFHDNRIYFQTGSNGYEFRNASGGNILNLTTAGVISGNLSFANNVNFNSANGGAITIVAGGDIRMSSGNWTGEHAGKIQYHSNKMYLQGGSNGHQLRDHNGNTTFEINPSGTCAGVNLSFSQDCQFAGGASAVSIAGGSDIRLSSGGWTGNAYGKIQNHNQSLYICGGSTSSYSIIFRVDGADKIYMTTGGTLYPTTNNASDLGTSANRWSNVYTNDLNLSNKGSTNSIDNTWGDYTIQEGESDLFLINNRSGKKYKFNLTEVN